MQYTVDTAIEALGLKGKKQLADRCQCHVQSLYMLKDGVLGSRLNVVVGLLVENKKLGKRVSDLEMVVSNKQLIIDELKK